MVGENSPGGRWKYRFNLHFFPPGPPEVRRADWEEDFVRAYLYWTPHPWLALSAEYQFERFDRDPEATGVENIVEIDTHRFPLAISFFHPSGFSACLKGTYIDQDGEFEDPMAGVVVLGDDQFWIVDASVGYRLPKRWGLITLGVRNLFDEEFKFQDTDPANPVIHPQRFIFARFALAF